MSNYEYDFFEDFKDKLDWDKISRWGDMDEHFIVQFENELDWNILSTVQGLTEYLIRRFNNKINWNNIRSNYHIPQELRDILINEYNNQDIDEHDEESDEERINNDIEIDIVPLEPIIEDDEDDDMQMVD